MKRFTAVPAELHGTSDDAEAPAGGPVVDTHQHLWPTALVEQLRRRRSAPRLEGWTLSLAGEPDYEVDPCDHDIGRRRELDLADGVDLTVLSLSSPLGIEFLPPEESAPLLQAWHSYGEELAGPGGDVAGAYGVWAAVNLVEPDLEMLATTLGQHWVHGLQVPATSLADPAAVARLAPVLAVVEAAGLPVLVHPGPAPAVPGAALPAWWPALTSYPAQLAAAWFAWHVAGRDLLPRLQIAFVALAGLAPLHHERLAQRGGELRTIDPLVFYDTSSYGTRAVDAMTRVVGVDCLVHGSDRPYALPTDPGLGGAFGRLLFVTNPARLLPRI